MLDHRNQINSISVQHMTHLDVLELIMIVCSNDVAWVTCYRFQIINPVQPTSWVFSTVSVLLWLFLSQHVLDEQANLNSIFTDAMTIIDLLNGMYNSQSAGG
jgi:hypothetical protein